MTTDTPETEPDFVIDPFVNSVWALIYSMIERGVTGSDGWWGQDFLAVKRQLEEMGLNCDPSKDLT